ncbi:Exosome complex exonuclease RRP4 [Paragonimus heterotremus]|uniref:Exosome complex exonuclease RRP4 n=1 Tax=Paragonimus heterotremus TaxID=100268 RepID=A0A8J4SKB9_9TREM|nr:Exosome complex exonuclease RRP4 [Paragonimus heterotremus]
MPISMYPALAAPERSTPDYALHGQRSFVGSMGQGSAVVPGEIIFPSGSNLITGHGTYRENDSVSSLDRSRMGVNTIGESQDGLEGQHLPETIQTAAMRTSLTGRVRIVNKLVYIEPAKARYAGNVGDTVVGRIVEVEQRRWRVDLCSALLGNLALANVKLPGGELRRKSEDDERAMRFFMKEGDLIVAEVHEVYKDGTLQLHMPGTRTGKLGGGCLLRIPPSLVKRQKIHRHRLAIPRTDAVRRLQSTSAGAPAEMISVGLILGCNGYIWIGPSRAMDIGLRLAAPLDSADCGTAEGRHEQLAERLAVSRVRNCILALSHNGMPVWETSVLAACEASWLMDQQADEDASDDEDAAVDMIDSSGIRSSNRHVQNQIARLLRPDVSQKLVSLVHAKLGSTT